MNGDGSIADFPSQQEAEAFAKRQDILIEETVPQALDLAWIPDCNRVTIDCAKTLNAWNFFSDIAVSLQSAPASGLLALQKNSGVIYEKLFWGNNLPAVTPPGEHYDPEWSLQEKAHIRLILQSGLNLFLDNLAMH